MRYDELKVLNSTMRAEIVYLARPKMKLFYSEKKGGLIIDSKSHVRFSEKACPFLGNRTCDLEKRDMRFLG